MNFTGKESCLYPLGTFLKMRPLLETILRAVLEDNLEDMKGCSLCNCCCNWMWLSFNNLNGFVNIKRLNTIASYIKSLLAPAILFDHLTLWWIDLKIFHLNNRGDGCPSRGTLYRVPPWSYGLINHQEK
jgi:hypothetical protein